MRLIQIQEYLHSRGIAFRYLEDNDCGSIEFTHHGLPYHIWEYPAPERGAESNVRSTGKTEDFEGDYEQDIINILRNW